MRVGGRGVEGIEGARLRLTRLRHDVYYSRETETFITELGEGRKTTLKGGLKLRKAKATTLGMVLHARSCAMGGGDVVGEVKGVEEVGV